MSDRKVVLEMVVSLDGFAASTDGTMSGCSSGPATTRASGTAAPLGPAGVHAMGRRSYERPSSPARWSRRRWGPVEIFGGDLGAAIADLKARDDAGTVLVHGGPGFARSLTRLGLVGEYQLITVPAPSARAAGSASRAAPSGGSW